MHGWTGEFGTNGTPPASKDGVFNYSEQLRLTVGRTVEKPHELSEKNFLGQSDFPRDLPWANFQTILKAFPLLVRLQASQPKKMCPTGVV